MNMIFKLTATENCCTSFTILVSLLGQSSHSKRNQANPKCMRSAAGKSEILAVL